MSDTAHTITVYTREDCHLCEEAIETIDEVSSSVPAAVETTLVDVDDEPALAQEYGERVPYVLVDGRPAFKYTVDRDRLEDLLSSA